MLLVGLTGGIASGKTLVRRRLEELGARTIDADEVARELVSPGSKAWSRIVEVFGPSFLAADGTIDRRRLADLIFADPGQRAALEEILHPLIGNEIAARIERCRRENPDGIMVVDAALLVEIGMHEDFDRLVLVYADEGTRVDRLMARDRLTRHEAYRRLHAQMPLESKLQLADFVIDNSGPPEKALRETDVVFGKLREAGKEPA